MSGWYPLHKGARAGWGHNYTTYRWTDLLPYVRDTTPA